MSFFSKKPPKSRQSSMNALKSKYRIVKWNRQIGLDRPIEGGTKHRPIARFSMMDCLWIAAAIIFIAAACWLTQLDDHDWQASRCPSSSNELNPS